MTATNETKASAGVIRLRYPSDATGDLSYSLNGAPFTLTPGESFMMMTGRDWKLNFSAGEPFGERVAEISEAGNYVFEMTDDEGWVIVEEAPTEFTEVEETSELEVPTVETPVIPTDSPGELKLDAPNSTENGNSVLDRTEEIDETAPPATLENDDN